MRDGKEEIMTDQTYTPAGAEVRASSEDFKVVAVSSIGSVFEWFDFFLYGSLAVILSRHFFANVDPQSAFILALLAFAAGYVARPFGALVFGALGDKLGRKRTFLLALILMGIATFSVGLLPTYALRPTSPSTSLSIDAGSIRAGCRSRRPSRWP